jgi:hypothetical protein
MMLSYLCTRSESQRDADTRDRITPLINEYDARGKGSNHETPITGSLGAARAPTRSHPRTAFNGETIHFGTTCQLWSYPLSFKGSCSM